MDANGQRVTYAYAAVQAPEQVIDPGFAALPSEPPMSDAGFTVLPSASPDLGWGPSTPRFGTVYRPTQVQDALGNLWTTIYDAAGSVEATVDPRGNRTSYSYDTLNRLTQVKDALGDISTAVYDAVGNLLAAVNALGQTVSYSYDADNRLTQIQDATGILTSIIDDARGDIKAAIDGLGTRTSYGYARFPASSGMSDAGFAVQPDAPQQVNIPGLGVGTPIPSWAYATPNQPSSNDAGFFAVPGPGPGEVIWGPSPGQSGPGHSAGSTLGLASSRGLPPNCRPSHDTAPAAMALSGTGNAIDPAFAIPSNSSVQANDPAFSVPPSGPPLMDAGFFATPSPGAGEIIWVPGMGGMSPTPSFGTAYLPTQVQDALGNLTSIIYDAAGNQTGMMDASGAFTRLARNALGETVASCEIPEGAVSVVQYDSGGNVAASVDAPGNGNR